MYTSKLNIKHNRSAEIHWGVHKLTNEIIWIDDVEGNGYSCNCKCACCGSDLKACTQGKIQQHHFKHRGNNGCYYSDEIAEYLKAKELLSSLSSMWLPPIDVRIGNRTQVIQPAIQSTVNILQCTYDANHYPPLLIANIDSKPVRIILSFSEYYTENDYRQLIDDARANCWNCLEIILPQKDDGVVVSKEILYEYISGQNRNKRWIFNSKSHDCFIRLKNASKKINPTHTKYGEITDTEYECPLHKREFNGNFYAFKNDCEVCEFRLDFYSDCCRCLGEAFVKELSDLDTPEHIRRAQLLSVQQENESKIEELREREVAKKNIQQAEKSNVLRSQQDRELFDTETAIQSFQKQVCPYCGKRLHKQIGKCKINWLCLTSRCDFCVVEDKETHAIKMLYNGKEVK